jgi:hypothetical protein
VAVFYFSLPITFPVTLGASGSIANKDDMSGLLKFYTAIGFEVDRPEDVKAQLANEDEVPMSSTIQILIANCNKR